MKAYIPFFFLLLFNIISIKGDDDDYDPTKVTEEDDKKNCEYIDPSIPCRSRKLSEGRLCCDIYEVTADDISETCEVKTTKEEQMLIVGSSKIINKELGGLQIYNSEYGGIAGNSSEERKEIVQRTIRITCDTWDFSVNIIDGDEYTEKEINILESENHCLSYFTPLLLHISSNRRPVSREICYKASLLPSTRRQGLSCGYMEIDIQEEHGIIEKRQTCFIYDPKVTSSKKLDEATRLNLNALSKKNENPNVNYQFNLFGYNGTGYSYDSSTGIVRDKKDDPSIFDYNDFLLHNDLSFVEEEENQPNKNDSSRIMSRLSINCVLLLIIFILL